MNRSILLLVVLITLLLNILMQRVVEANPLTHPTLWELRHALPAGVTAATLFITALGMGAQMWRGILPLCRVEWTPQRRWSYFTVGAMWCGLLPLLCALAYYPAAEAGTSPSPWAATGWLVAGGAAYIACRVITLVWKRRLAWLAAALGTAAVAVLFGQKLWPATPLDVLVVGLASAASLELLCEREPSQQLVWLMSAAVFFCAYTAAFGYMLAFYPPGETAPASPWGMWMAVVFAALGLAFVIFALLRRTVWGRRTVSLLALGALGAWVWLHFAATLSPQEQVPALGCYLVALALFSIPGALFLRRMR